MTMLLTLLNLCFPLFAALAATSPLASTQERSRLPLRDDLETAFEYLPIPTSHLRVNELHHGATSKYINSGLSGLMGTVDAEYGLRSAESFYWGPAGNPLANLTAYVGSQTVRVLSMERFSDVLDAAECASDCVMLKFKDAEVDFDRVRAEWAWVNEQEEHYIVLVTESERCNVPDGDGTDRQPWHVKSIDFDDDSNTVTLRAEPKTWRDAFDHWRLRVSSASARPAGHGFSLRKRIGYDDTTSVDLAADFSTDAVEFEDAGSETAGTVSCDPCYTAGQMEFDVDVTWWFFEGLKGSVTVTPTDVGVFVTTSVETEQEIMDTLTTGRNLFTLAPSRIYIKGLVNIGPNFKIDLSATLGPATAHLSTTTDLSLTLPSDSIATLNIDDPAKNKVSGWNPLVDTHVDIAHTAANDSLESSIALALRLELDAQILDFGLMAGLALSAPQLSTTLGGFFEDGVCEGTGFGGEVQGEMGVGWALDAFAGRGEAVDMPNKVNLLEDGAPVWKSCVPVEGKGSMVTAAGSAETVAPYPVLRNSTGAVPPSSR